MPGSMPATSQLDWLSSMTAMIVLFWSRATRDLLKSFGWGIAGTPSIRYSDEVAISRRPPHSISRSPWTHRSLQLSLDCVRAAARPTHRACDLDRRVRSLRRQDFLERFVMRQIASLTVTRAGWSTFGRGPRLRQQERRAAVGLEQA